MEARLAELEHAPVFRSPKRAWRWCVLRTIRDRQLAERRGRPISGPNARRLWMRRLRRMISALLDPSAGLPADFKNLEEAR